MMDYAGVLEVVEFPTDQSINRFGPTYSIRQAGNFWLDSTGGRRRAWSTDQAADVAMRTEAALAFDEASTGRQSLDDLIGYLHIHVKMRKGMSSPPEGFNFSCNEDYVLTVGSPQIRSVELTDHETEAVLSAASGLGILRAKECFYNAQRLVMNDQSGLLKYVEGYGHGAAIIPMHHAWVTINGKVIDFTWRRDKPKGEDIETMLSNETGTPVLGVVPSGWAYIGREFSRDKIVERIVSDPDGMVMAFLDDWKAGFPHLHEPRPEPDIVRFKTDELD